MSYNFHWAAALENYEGSSDSILKHIDEATIIDQSVNLKPIVHGDSGDTEIAAYVFPNNSPVQWLYLVSGRADSRKVEHPYPFCRSGISVDITVTAIIPLDERAMVGRIEGYSDGSSLSFF